MSDEKPYGSTYHTEITRLYDEQKNAAQRYTANTLYMRESLYLRDDALRNKEAEEAAAEWLRLDADINALNAAEYRKKQAAS